MNVSLFLEIKNEYTEHVLDTLTPYIQEGLMSIYYKAFEDASRANDTGKTLMIFQKYLKAIEEWPQTRIDDETQRIKINSNTTQYFDDLIKALIKTHIILLTYSNNISNVIAETYYNNFSVNSFVHKCYIECAKHAYNNPYLFFHFDVSPLDVKRNNIIIENNIRDGIVRAVRKSLPISSILKEFLLNSVNIIPEPPKVELLGLPQSNNQINLPVIPVQPIPAPVALPSAPEPSNKIDPQLEREVLQIIQSEHNQTEKDKIRQIMKLDHIITSIDHGKHVNTDNEFKLNQSDTRDRNPLNMGLAPSEKKVININIGRTPTKPSPKQLSATSVSNRPVAANNRGALDELSEQIDPSKIKPIENYGVPVQNGGRHSRRN